MPDAAAATDPNRKEDDEDQTNPDESGPNSNLVRECLRTVDRYRRNTLTKSEAIANIVQILGDYASNDSAEYIDMLDGSDRARERNERRGARTLRDDGDTGAGLTGEDGDDNGEYTAAGGRQLDDGAEPDRRIKRRRIGDADDDEDSVVDDKKREHGWAFYKEDDTLACDDPVLAETLIQKRRYIGKDGTVKAARARLATQFDKPDFPDSLWEYVLLGKYVDLDKVFTSIFVHGSNQQKLGRIGNVELAIGSSDPTPTKHITNHGEWVIAFGRYLDAVLYVYPGRAVELKRYQEYITLQFAAIGPGNHWRVLEYDKAVRTACGNSNKHRLDGNEFGHLVTQWLTGVGAGSGDTRTAKVPAGAASASKGPKPTCGRWNNGNCDYPNCTYRHVCNHCGSGEHRRINCPTAPVATDRQQAKGRK